MNRKQLALSGALIVLLAVDAYAIYLYGYIGFFRMVLANFAGFAAFVDLAIALVLILVWMGDDARERKVSALPYLVLTLALGSVGPLLYLIRRSADRTEPNASIAPRAVRN
ncbi:MAG: hypothetical protein WBQ86_09865 [Candidatus Binatus sp.]